MSLPRYKHQVGALTFTFRDLKDLMAKATPARSGDRLAGVAAATAQERAVAQMALAELPLRTFLNEALIPYEEDEVTRLIIDTHSAAAFAPVAHMTVGDFRNWLLADETGPAELAALRPGLTPEMVAAVSKLMRHQDLIAVARKCEVRTAFRSTIGGPGRLSTRLDPSHDSDQSLPKTIIDETPAVLLVPAERAYGEPLRVPRREILRGVGYIHDEGVLGPARLVADALRGAFRSIRR